MEVRIQSRPKEISTSQSQAPNSAPMIAASIR